MSGFLEKITLYDLLGYTIPGFVFFLIMLYGVYSTDTLVLLETYKNYNGFLAIVLLVASYLVGIAMSELGRIVDWIISKVLQKNTLLIIWRVLKEQWQTVNFGKNKLTWK